MILINFHIPIRCKESLWRFVISVIIYAFQQPKHVISELQSSSALCLVSGLRNHWHLRQMENGLLLVYFYNILYIFLYYICCCWSINGIRDGRQWFFMQTLYSLIAARTIQLNRFAFFLLLFFINSDQLLLKWFTI